MFYVPKKCMVEAKGRKVFLAEGPRGQKHTKTFGVVDLDASLRENLGPDVLAKLIKQGVIEERANAPA